MSSFLHFNLFFIGITPSGTYPLIMPIFAYMGVGGAKFNRCIFTTHLDYKMPFQMSSIQCICICNKITTKTFLSIAKEWNHIKYKGVLYHMTYQNATGCVVLCCRWFPTTSGSAAAPQVVWPDHVRLQQMIHLAATWFPNKTSVITSFLQNFILFFSPL